MMKKLLAFTALTFALASPLAFADGHGHKKGTEKFAAADTNGNGTLELSEMIAKATERTTKHFQKLDANGDGSVTKDEMKKGRKGMREKMRERMKEKKERRQERRLQEAK